MTTDERRLEMGKAIVEFEGRYKDGRLQVYKLPPGDGGGSYEVAGINERYHPTMAAELKRMIEAGDYAKAEQVAASYIEQYTRSVTKFFPDTATAEANPAIEFVLRDCAFNRGAKGAATMLQIALGMADIDGVVGRLTKAEFAKQLVDPGTETVLHNLTQARETYERTSYPWKSGKRDENSKFWAGLSKRWKSAHRTAQSRFV